MTSRWRGVFSRHPRMLGFVFAAYWLAMFLATHIQLPEVDSAPKNTDKAVHLVMYAGFTLLCCTWLATWRGWTRNFAVLVLGIAVLYAGLDELLQLLTETRTADVWDFAMDLVGAILGLGLFGAMRARFETLWETSPRPQ